MNRSFRIPSVRLFRAATIIALVLAGPTGCGFGSAAVASLARGGSDENSAPSLSLDVQGFAITLPREPPAKIRLVLSDAESDPARVELLYSVPTDPTNIRPMAGLANNPVTLSTSPEGSAHDLTWNFAIEPGLPADASFIDGVKVIARLADGASRELIFGLGNDAPVIQSIDEPDSEWVGVVPIRFVVSDSSNDPVDVRAEYLIAGEAEWKLARQAGLLASSATPEFAFKGVQAPRNGETHLFFWDTDHPEQLRDLERGVRLRFTARDAVATGNPRATDPVTVDNNDVPIVEIDESFIVSQDTRRGIPIPFRVVDAESDEVRVLFQWRRAFSEYPTIETTDPAELAVLLQDREWARAHQVCSARDRYASGRVKAIDSTHARLAELGAEQSWILAEDPRGLKFELVRPRTAHTLSDAWTASPLVRPVSAVPIGDGTRAIVLDESPGGWRLFEFSLVDGATTREINAGEGQPTALAIDRGQGSALVAAQLDTRWDVHQIDLHAGTTTRLVAHDGTDPVRGLVFTGSHAALATAGNTLWRLDWLETTQTTVTPVISDLANPCGIVTDPIRPDRIVFVAEQGADRIVQIDTYERTARPAFGRNSPKPDFPSPTSIAFDETNHRILAVCAPTTGAVREIRATILGRDTDSKAHSVATLEATDVHVAIGHSNLVLATRRDHADIVAVGGIAQARRITSFDVRTKVIELEHPLHIAARDAQQWRIHARDPFFEPFRANPIGRLAVFTWDSEDVSGGGEVQIRAMCFDTEQGRVVETSAAKRIDHALQGTASTIDALSGYGAPLCVDVDLDGDLDFVTAGANAVRVHFQTAPREFEPDSIVIPTAIDPRIGSQSQLLVASDIDDDGDIDFVAADTSAAELGLTVLLQDTVGGFSPTSWATGARVWSVQVADMDGDDSADIVATLSDRVLVYRQVSQGSFEVVPPEVSVPNFARLARVADLDADGRADLVVAADLDAHVFFQDQSGGFTTPPTTLLAGSLSELGSGALDATLADFNGDGRPDVAVTTVTDQSVRIFLQEQGRRFTPGIQVADFDSPFSFALLAAPGDLNRDGDIDLVIRGQREMLGTFQDSRGEFHLGRRWDNDPLLSGGEPATAACDLDGDGQVDVVGVNVYGIPFVIYGDTRASHRREEVLAPSDDGNEAATAVAVADLNGDGILDVFSTNRRFSGHVASLTIFHQVLPTVFEPTPTAIALDGEHLPRAVRAADVDGDGAVDLLAAVSSALDHREKRLELRFGLLDGSVDLDPLVVWQATSLADDRFIDFVIADFDGDLDADIAIAFAMDDIGILYQTEPRVFTTSPHQIPGLRTDRWLRTADFDGDGRHDLIGASGQDVVVAWNDPGNEFTLMPLPPLPGSALDGRIEDLDANGYVDVIVNHTYGQVTLYMQEAPRVFSMTAGPLCASDGSLSVFDGDGDGYLDLRCGSFFLQSPTGEFEIADGFTTDLDVTAADLDGDGDFDVMVFDDAGIELWMGGR